MITASKVKKIRNWIINHGGEILPGTNEYEVLRAKTNQGTLVIYTNKKGSKLKPNDPILLEKVISWMKNRTNVILNNCKKTRKNISSKKKSLLIRDGNACFFCGERMDYEDMTIEHILSISHGGSNRVENLTLAHKSCNLMAGNMSVIEKINLREKLTNEKNTSN